MESKIDDGKIPLSLSKNKHDGSSLNVKAKMHIDKIFNKHSSIVPEILDN